VTVARERGRANLGRKRGTRTERLRVLIVTEGEKTEPQYFVGLVCWSRSSPSRNWR